MQFFGPSDLKSLEDGTVRTKWSHPYSYDPIVQFERRDVPEGVKIESPYTDRMRRWEPELFRTLQKKHFDNEGDYWDNRSPQDIEAFLRDYYSSPELVLTKVIEHCNVSNGYPVWQLFYYGRDTSNDA